MISGSRNLLWLLPLALLFSAPLWRGPLADFLTPHGRYEQRNARQGPLERTFVLTDVKLLRHKGGEREMALSAAKVESSSRGMEDLFLEEVDLSLYRQDGEAAHVTGGAGRYETTHNIVTMVEDVRLITSDNFELATDALRYLINWKVLKTACPVQVHSREGAMSGNGMMYNLASGAYRVGGRVVVDMR